MDTWVAPSGSDPTALLQQVGEGTPIGNGDIRRDVACPAWYHDTHREYREVSGMWQKLEVSTGKGSSASCRGSTGSEGCSGHADEQRGV